MKEYWDVQHGGARDQNGLLRTTKDIAEFIGESNTNTKRLLKLNSLIPRLQQLVSDGSLGTTAAEQLAYLTEDEQKALYEGLGNSVRTKWPK